MRRPDTEEALAALLREGRPVHVRGNGTKLSYGPAPAQGAVEVSLGRLDRIVAHEPGDLVVTVQAGARLADLQAALGRHGQWLPLDPPFRDATIGGILATNSSGPRRLGYGTARDLLLGLQVAGPDGVLTRSGGRVVKNVTGYDLHKLHVGAFGTLGILLEASFKVRPKPDVSAGIVFSCGSFEEAHRLLLEIHALPLRPAALEAVERRAIAVVEGTRPVLERHLRDLRALGRPLEVIEGEPLEGALRDDGPAGAVRIRMGARPHDLAGRVPPGLRRRVQAGTGVARVDLEPAPDLPERILAWHREAAARGGYVAAEAAPLEYAGRERLAWNPLPHRLMRALRESRDPSGILNRGRIVV